MILNMSDSQTREFLKKHIDKCNSDELSRLLGDCLDGQCWFNHESKTYEIESKNLNLDLKTKGKI